MMTGTRCRGSSLIQIYLHYPSLVPVCYASSRVSADRFSEPVPRECYKTLKVTPDSSVQEVKESYIELARKYHPDADLKTANSEEFAKINYAYNTIMKKLQQQQQLPIIDDNDDEKEKKFSSPQHRQYLSYEGFGTGTMSQREKQYNQRRVMRAAEKVHEYRTENLSFSQEEAMVLKDKKSTRKFKMSNAIERVVEDLIQDAMGKGEFHNLSGSGKPLSYSSHNPMLDITTHNLNKVLINNGYTPEWILIRKDIIETLRRTRSNLAKSLSRTEVPDNVSALNKFQIEIKGINQMIDKYNMVVPILNKQMVHYSYQKELEKIQRNPKEFILDISKSGSSDSNMKDALRSDPINWSQVWKDIKDNFR